MRRSEGGRGGGREEEGRHGSTRGLACRHVTAPQDKGDMTLGPYGAWRNVTSGGVTREYWCYICQSSVQPNWLLAIYEIAKHKQEVPLEGEEAQGRSLQRAR